MKWSGAKSVVNTALSASEKRSVSSKPKFTISTVRSIKKNLRSHVLRAKGQLPKESAMKRETPTNAPAGKTRSGASPIRFNPNRKNGIDSASSGHLRRIPRERSLTESKTSSTSWPI